MRGWGKQIKPPLEMPAKKWFAMSESARHARRVALESYLQQLTKCLNWSVHPQLRAFFEADTWLKPRKPKPAAAAAANPHPAAGP